MILIHALVNSRSVLQNWSRMILSLKKDDEMHGNGANKYWCYMVQLFLFARKTRKSEPVFELEKLETRLRKPDLKPEKLGFKNSHFFLIYKKIIDFEFLM